MMSKVGHRKWAAALLLSATLAWAGQAARAEAPATAPAGERADAPSAAGAVGPAVHLFSVGDWGLDSPDRQTVADAMAARTAVDGKPQAVLLLGDNYYVTLSDVHDPQIQTFFEQTYSPTILNMPFYAVLGNHDYKNNNAQIELDYARGNTRFKMPARWYRLDLPADGDPSGKPIATVLMLDSDHDYMPAGMWNEELTWINNELAKPHAPWVMACAHHDMFGNGSHGDNGVLQKDWGTLFKQYGVQIYLCGHEHTLQHLEIPGWPISFVIAGGGGAKHKGMLQDKRGPFSKAEFGFADVHFTPTTAVVQLIDEHGKLAHAFTRSLDGNVQITLTTPSDKAVKNPLKLISGGGD